ncbi:PIN domain-containing protein [Candidatus Daviesbacteria bacterium]|nr:PIN domain-containing protein [Candidatus Daviesbacteria bacterium]
MNGIKKFKLVGLDSNIFIYLFEKNPEFIKICQVIVDLLEKDQIQSVTSVVSIIETLSFPSPLKVLKGIETGFKSMPNLTIIDVDQGIAIEAAKLRRKYGFRTPDAIQLATAKLNRAKAFVTNDERLKAYQGLKVIALADIK